MSCPNGNTCRIWMEAGCADPDLIEIPPLGASSKRERRYRLEAQDRARKAREEVCQICKIERHAARVEIAVDKRA